MCYHNAGLKCSQQEEECERLRVCHSFYIINLLHTLTMKQNCYSLPKIIWFCKQKLVRSEVGFTKANY